VQDIRSALRKHFGIARGTVARLLVENMNRPHTYTRHAPRPTPVADVVNAISSAMRPKRNTSNARHLSSGGRPSLWTELQRMGIIGCQNPPCASSFASANAVAKGVCPVDVGPANRPGFDSCAVVGLSVVKQPNCYLPINNTLFRCTLQIEFFPLSAPKPFCWASVMPSEAWGGVPEHCVCDSTKTAVKTILRE